jgi:hypothetical protein
LRLKAPIAPDDHLRDVERMREWTEDSTACGMKPAQSARADLNVYNSDER